MTEPKPTYSAGSEPLNMNTIEQIHTLVWEFRKANSDWWITPPPDDCVRYAFTEAGELMDAWLRSQRTGDARNNVKLVGIDHELADVAIMLASSVVKIPEMDWMSVLYHPTIDDVCKSVGDCLDAIDGAYVGATYICAMADVMGFATDNNIDLVAQVKDNLKAIEWKHCNGIETKGE